MSTFLIPYDPTQDYSVFAYKRCLLFRYCEIKSHWALETAGMIEVEENVREKIWDERE